MALLRRPAHRVAQGFFALTFISKAVDTGTSELPVSGNRATHRVIDTRLNPRDVGARVHAFLLRAGGSYNRWPTRQDSSVCSCRPAPTDQDSCICRSLIGTETPGSSLITRAVLLNRYRVRRGWTKYTSKEVTGHQPRTHGMWLAFYGDLAYLLDDVIPVARIP